MSIDDEAVEQPTVPQTAHQTVGQRLRAAREARGIDLVDIARDTRIPLRHLNALEADSHDGLPALTYTIGFVKAFAGALGLPPEEIAAQFRGETTKVVHVPQPSLIEPLDQRRAPPAWAVWAGGLGVVALIGALIAYGLGAFDPPAPTDPVEVAAAEPLAGGEEVDQRVDPQPVEPAAAAAPAAPAASVAAAPPPVAAGAEVAITAREDVWIKVYDRSGGPAVRMGILRAGERYVVPQDRGELLLWTGKAGVLDITVAGRPVAPLGGTAQTVRDVSLAPASLAARAG